MNKSREVPANSQTPLFPDTAGRGVPVAPGFGWTTGFAAALLAGCLFRLIWPGDMPFMGDEAWTASHVAAFAADGHWPPAGMISSAGIPNAGLSLWAFFGLGGLFGWHDPLDLVRGVQWCGIAALLLLTGFIRFDLARPEREAWFWSVALSAVSPLQVLLQRKIWPPSILPLFSVTVFVAWWHRGRPCGAFLWGLVGMLLGQIQFAGFFFQAALFLAVLGFDRASVCWRFFLLGSLLGALPMLPWLLLLLHGAAGQPQGAEWINLLPAFPLEWLGAVLGFGADYVLGGSLPLFLLWPRPLGVPLCLAAVAGWAIAFVFVIQLHRFLRARALAPERPSDEGRLARWRARLGLDAAQGQSAPSATLLLLNAATWIFALLLLATLRPLYMHYLAVLFSLPSLWLARLALGGNGADSGGLVRSRRLLATMVVAQASLTLTFLYFIHVTEVIDGIYGTVYHAQMKPPG